MVKEGESSLFAALADKILLRLMGWKYAEERMVNFLGEKYF